MTRSATRTATSGGRVIDSPALERYAMVRLLLPRRFQAEPGRRWPVPWLLHGCCDTYQSWTRSTDVEERGLFVAVVPDDPMRGWLRPPALIWAGFGRVAQGTRSLRWTLPSQIATNVSGLRVARFWLGRCLHDQMCMAPRRRALRPFPHRD